MIPEILGIADVDDALALSAGESWNQTAEDWRRLVELEPDGCFALREDGQLVGTVTTTMYDPTLAWIGMMVVRQSRRRRGIGALLMRHALVSLERRSIRTVKLDATPAGQPLYESLGFVAEVEFERWQGVVPPHSRHTSSAVTVTSRELVVAADAAAYGVNRSRLIDALIDGATMGVMAVSGDAGSHPAFALARRGRAATYVGPIVASTSHDAEHLLASALGQLAGHEVCLDRHAGGLLTSDALADRGLTKRRVLVRMRYGTPNAAGTGRNICGSAGPEYG